MTTPQADQMQQHAAELERIVTRVARRAADAGAQQNADLCVQLALASETVDGLTAALEEKTKVLADKDAELARAHQAADELRARIAALEAAAAANTD